jgi:hypothetical protein
MDRLYLHGKIKQTAPFALLSGCYWSTSFSRTLFNGHGLLSFTQKMINTDLDTSPWEIPPIGHNQIPTNRNARSEMKLVLLVHYPSRLLGTIDHNAFLA